MGGGASSADAAHFQSTAKAKAGNKAAICCSGEQVEDLKKSRLYSEARSVRRSGSTDLRVKLEAEFVLN